MIKGSHLSNAQMKILDATASNRSIWYQKNNPFTVFLDKRCGKEYMVTENSNFDNNCVIRVFPDVQAIWQHLPFIDNRSLRQQLQRGWVGSDPSSSRTMATRQPVQDTGKPT